MQIGQFLSLSLFRVFWQVFDATNSTAERRKMIHEIVVNKWGYKLFFVESICDDPQIIEQNIMVSVTIARELNINYYCCCYCVSFLFFFVCVAQEVKVSSPDYVNMNTDNVLRDFLLRIEHYQEKYQVLDEVTEKDLSYMKIYNTGEKVVVHKHEGHIQSRIVYYLMNIHITPRTIYLTRVCSVCDSIRSKQSYSYLLLLLYKTIAARRE